MNKHVKKNTPALERRIRTELQELIHGAESDARSSLRKILLGGMRLCWLHQNTAKDPQENLRTGPDFSREKSGDGNGFLAALEEQEMRVATAYRWMNKTKEVAAEIGILKGEFPEPDTEQWAALETQCSLVVERMGLRRLMIGSAKKGSEPDRMELLLKAAEAGDPDAVKYLEMIEEGSQTSATAIRAMTGGAATRGKERNDPVYLKYDLKKKKVAGLVPKAITALRNGFEKWESYEEDDRAEVIKQWREMLKKAPKELLDLFQ